VVDPSGFTRRHGNAIAKRSGLSGGVSWMVVFIPEGIEEGIDARAIALALPSCLRCASGSAKAPSLPRRRQGTRHSTSGSTACGAVGRAGGRYAPCAPLPFVGRRHGSARV
jgi:hypothetical protein